MRKYEFTGLHVALFSLFFTLGVTLGIGIIDSKYDYAWLEDNHIEKLMLSKVQKRRDNLIRGIQSCYDQCVAVYYSEVYDKRSKDMCFRFLSKLYKSSREREPDELYYVE